MPFSSMNIRYHYPPASHCRGLSTRLAVGRWKHRQWSAHPCDALHAWNLESCAVAVEGPAHERKRAEMRGGLTVRLIGVRPFSFHEQISNEHAGYRQRGETAGIVDAHAPGELTPGDARHEPVLQREKTVRQPRSAQTHETDVHTERKIVRRYRLLGRCRRGRGWISRILEDVRII